MCTNEHACGARGWRPVVWYPPLLSGLGLLWEFEVPAKDGVMTPFFGFGGLLYPF
ncbi:MAG TPA: hypothetical protein VEG44_07445 [Candidatus Acidoferrales bacterium]|nr:hypothetical protein [Candidatus Acidoferrales bacterium]